MKRACLIKATGVRVAVAALLAISSGAIACAVVESTEDMVRRGGDLLGEERFEDALVLFDRALKSDPNCVKAVEMRAKTFDQMGENEKALAEYSRLVTLFPNNPIYYKDRSLVRLELKQYSEAIDDMSKMLSLGRDPMTYYTRGCTYELIGDHEKAVQDFTKFLSECQDKGGRTDAFFNRANSYFELKQNEKALEDLASAEKTDNGRAAANNPISRGMSSSEDLARLSLTPEYAKAYYSRGQVYDSLGHTKEAIDSYSRAISINPESPDYYKVRAAAYEKLGQLDKANEDKGKASSLSAKVAANQTTRQARSQPAASASRTAGKGEAGPNASAGTGKGTDLEKFDLHLSELEAKFLGRNYSDDLLPDRLARLEQKLFSKAQTGSYKHRLDALMLKSGQ